MRLISPIVLLVCALSSSLLHSSAAIFAPIGSPISFITPTAAPESSPQLYNTASTSNNLLKSFCSHTDYYDLCINSFKETASGLKALDNYTILTTLMQAIDIKAREAKSIALQLVKESSFDTKTRELLHDCANFYDDALDNLETATQAIKVGDDGMRDSVLSSMISNFGTCEDGFNEFTIKSPMAEWSKTLQNMVDNCLAIINMNRPQDYY